MQEEYKIKQELEDRSRIRKASLLPVSKVDHQLIKTKKSEIDRIVVENLAHYKKEHSKELASSYYSNESSENKKIEEEKEIRPKTPSLFSIIDVKRVLIFI